MADSKKKFPTGLSLALDGKDKQFDVVNFSFNFNQGLNADGRPNASVHGGQIHVTVFCKKDTSIRDWMHDSGGKLDGNITVYESVDGDTTMKKLEFKKGYCIHLAESYTSGPSGTQTFTIAADEILLDGTSMVQNDWEAS